MHIRMFARLLVNAHVDSKGVFVWQRIKFVKDWSMLLRANHIRF